MNVIELVAENWAKYQTGLAHLLKDCVDDGASIGFVTPFSLTQAEAYWQRMAQSQARAERRVFIIAGQNAVSATIQVCLDMPDNGQHRAEIAKLMVAPDQRRRGFARQLMLFAEQIARAEGWQLIVLDTRSGDSAEQLYLSLGYQLAGIIPDYARAVGGQLCATSYLYKQVSTEM